MTAASPQPQPPGSSFLSEIREQPQALLRLLEHETDFEAAARASSDETLPTVVEAAARSRNTGATLVVSGNASDEIEGAAYRLPVPEPATPLLSPLLSVVPGQLFSAALAHAKELDADHPEWLTKVTLAQ